jgi:hypothetical protein
VEQFGHGLHQPGSSTSALRRICPLILASLRMGSSSANTVERFDAVSCAVRVPVLRTALAVGVYLPALFMGNYVMTFPSNEAASKRKDWCRGFADLHIRTFAT